MPKALRRRCARARPSFAPAPNASNPTDRLTATIHEALDRRLETSSDRPLAVALSGGGDSVALLTLAAEWARLRSRRLIALTVDHGLHPDSARWTAFAADVARQHGADWRGLRWTGDKPASGLPAAARAARHRLLAEAARKAGARVVLFGHTRDDVAESDWMRARGATLGALRDWSPSPVWPEGRGLMLCRPMLALGRDDIRTCLRARGLGWLDDPANDDPRFGRSRARASLGAEPEPSHTSTACRTAEAAPPASPLGWAGVVRLRRDASGRLLSAALVCVGGGERIPRGDRVARLQARIETGENFTASLGGVRLEARGPDITLTREAGERRRGGLADTVLARGRPVVWDGRFEIASSDSGRLAAAAGHRAALAPADRAVLAALPPSARAAVPVLFRDDGARPVLAWRAGRVRCLVPSRLFLACGGASREAEIEAAFVGETAPGDLFQRCDGGDPPERASRT